MGVEANDMWSLGLLKYISGVALSISSFSIKATTPCEQAPTERGGEGDCVNTATFYE